ncbi:hypothetical protein ACWEJZ_02060 [Streptomyces bacillaris]|uniref:hypothetical protein n=1 Tax=Streptomyces sp. S8 TaxID=1837283 RepID=UPI001EF011E6|nr:hypothetical protein [Streptomyces sp. S8]
MALPASYCSDACADLVWIRGHLAAVEPTPQTLALTADLRDIERTLAARNDPTDVDQILDYSVLIDGDLL